jgi:hypothetical protein
MVSIPFIPVEDLATTAEAAPLCKSTPATLRSWRRDGVHIEGREFIRFGSKTILYLKPVLQAWLTLRNYPERYLAFVQEYLESVGLRELVAPKAAHKKLDRSPRLSSRNAGRSRMKLPAN